MEKITHIVPMASRKMCHNFEAHKIRVLIDQSLGDLFNNLEASTRIGKWSAEFLEYNITFKSRSAIKPQDLTDFIVDSIGPSFSSQ